jgi:hypothetical protein
MLYQVLADITVFIHLLFILFLIFGLLLIVLGIFKKWPIIKDIKFRALHLLGFLIVVGFEFAGLLCPLTYLEIYLREKEDLNGVYFGSFIAHYIEKIIYWEIPLELIVIPTSAVTFLTALLFILVPPEIKRSKIYQN